MRLAELLSAPEAAASGVVIVRGATDAPDDLPGVPSTRTVRQVALGEEIHLDADTTLLVTVGTSGSLANLRRQLEDLDVSQLLLLCAEAPAAASVERAVATLGAAGYMPIEVTELAYERLAGAVRVERTDASADDETDAQERTADAVARLQALHGDEGELARRTTAAYTGRLRAAEAARERDAARIDDLQRQVRTLRRELRTAERRRTTIERSSSYRLGRAIVQGVRDPRQLTRLAAVAARKARSMVLARVPASLRRRLPAPLRRRLGVTATRSAATTTTTPQVPLPDAATQLKATVTAVASAARPAPRPSIAAVVPDAPAEALAAQVALTRLLPHDARDLVSQLAPQLLLVSSSAFAAGEAWAGAGSGAVPARDAQLAALLDTAGHAGTPAVLWWDTPRSDAPGLTTLVDRFDLVVGDELAWTLGVPVPRLWALPTPDDDGSIGLVDPRGIRRVDASLEGRVTRYGARVGDISRRDPWGMWASHPAWLVPGVEDPQATAAAVAGARPVVAGPLDTSARELGAVALDDLGANGADGPSIAPLTDVERWRAARAVATDRGVLPSLDALGELLGVRLVPATRQGVALVVQELDDITVAAVLSLRSRPAGSVVVVRDGTPHDRVRDELAAAGVRVSDGWIPTDVHAVADLDPDRHRRGHLDALLAAAAVTDADVVVADADVEVPVTTSVAHSGHRDRLVKRSLLTDRDSVAQLLEGALPERATAVRVPAAAEDKRRR